MTNVKDDEIRYGIDKHVAKMVGTSFDSQSSLFVRLIFMQLLSKVCVYYLFTQMTTGWPKTLHKFLYALTLPNINQFSKLFYSQNKEKICNNSITKDPIIPQLCCYTTL